MQVSFDSLVMLSAVQADYHCLPLFHKLGKVQLRLMGQFDILGNIIWFIPGVRSVHTTTWTGRQLMACLSLTSIGNSESLITSKEMRVRGVASGL